MKSSRENKVGDRSETAKNEVMIRSTLKSSGSAIKIVRSKRNEAYVKDVQLEND